MFLFRRNRSRPLLYVYLATLVVFLVAVLVLHVHGTALDVIRVARIVLIVGVIGIGSMLRRRNARLGEPAPQDESNRDSR